MKTKLSKLLSQNNKNIYIKQIVDIILLNFYLKIFFTLLTKNKSILKGKLYNWNNFICHLLTNDWNLIGANFSEEKILVLFLKHNWQTDRQTDSYSSFWLRVYNKSRKGEEFYRLSTEVMIMIMTMMSFQYSIQLGWKYLWVFSCAREKEIRKAIKTSTLYGNCQTNQTWFFFLSVCVWGGNRERKKEVGMDDFMACAMRSW